MDEEDSIRFDKQVVVITVAGGGLGSTHWHRRQVGSALLKQHLRRA